MNIFPLYERSPIIPSVSAQREMDEIGIDLFLVKKVLEKGYDCQRSRRERNIRERCIHWKGKELRVVVALVSWKGKSFWRVTHVGKAAKH